MSKSHLPLAIVLVLGGGFLAYAQLGGASGIVVPFAGTLMNGVSAVDGDVDLTFPVYNQAVGGSPCQTVSAPATTVSTGRFAVELELNDTCVRGRDVFVEVSVAGTLLPGRQRIFPALAAMTSGSGDFDVDGHLSAGSADVTGALETGSLGTGALEADSVAIFGPARVQTGPTSNSALLSGKALVITGGFSDGNTANGGFEVRHDNQTQGVGIGYNTVYATGSNLDQELRLESRGSSRLTLNPDGNAPVRVGSDLYYGAIVNNEGAESRYEQQLGRYKVVAPYRNQHYRSYTPISEARLVQYCGDGDGCTVTIRMLNWNTAPGSQTAATRGPYHFDYGAYTAAANGRPWRLSNSDASGIDGNGSVSHAINTGDISWDCYFTDGQYFGGNTASNDNSRGMGLLNSGNNYTADCELLIDD